MNCIGLLFIVIFIHEAAFQNTDEILLPEENKQGFVRNSDHLKYVERLGGSSDGYYNTVTWKYHVILFNYTPQLSSPIMYFRHEGQENGYDTGNGCIGGEDYEDFFGYDPRLVSLKEYPRISGLDSECLVDVNNDTILICKGSLNIAVGVDVQWYASVVYKCSYERFLNLWYNISIIPYQKIQCKNTKDALTSLQVEIPNLLQLFVDTCAGLYDTYSEFNIIGFQPLDLLLGSQVYYRAEDISCYRNLFAFACYTALPQCINGSVIHSCAEMCEDYITGCSHSTLATSLECNSLSPKDSGDKCHYLPVYCSKNPELPPNALLQSVNGLTAGSVARFKCGTEYMMKGKAEAICGLSGDWSVDSSFECDEPQMQNIALVAGICTAVIVLAILVTAVVFLVFRLEIKLLQKRYFPVTCPCCRKSKYIDDNKLYHAFIAYQHEYYHFVRDNIHEKLEAEGYKIFTDYNDINFGEDLVERIPKAISQSFRVIIVLNQKFLDSKWCKYELRHSFIQLIEDNCFDVLVILTENQKTLKNVPRYLKAHLRTKLYMTSTSENLVEQIKKNFPPVSAVETIQDLPLSVLDS